MRAEDLHPYTNKMLDVYELQKAGYPYTANDLTLEEWKDLGKVKAILKPPLTCPLIGRK